MKKIYQSPEFAVNCCGIYIITSSPITEYNQFDDIKGWDFLE